MGSWLSRDAESVHFQRLNRRIYKDAGSRWGQIDGLLNAMRGECFVEREAETMRRALFHERSLFDRRSVIESFFQRSLWAKVCRGESFAWGWKDPRTSLTFPVWLRLFRRARCVHVIRNGIDVAISVHRRSRKQQRKWRNRILPLDYSPATLDFGHSFRLWEMYVSFILNHRDLLPSDRYLEVRYEDLLADPVAQLRRLAEFAGHPVTGEALSVACERIDRRRLDNSTYLSDYRDHVSALQASPLMQQLGYECAADQQ
jgi:hypothetical protein